MLRNSWEPMFFLRLVRDHKTCPTVKATLLYSPGLTWEQSFWERLLLACSRVIAPLGLVTGAASSLCLCPGGLSVALTNSGCFLRMLSSSRQTSDPRPLLHRLNLGSALVLATAENTLCRASEAVLGVHQRCRRSLRSGDSMKVTAEDKALVQGTPGVFWEG